MIISKTPLRASLFGGGTDLEDYYTVGKYGYGCVLSTAVNMYTYMTVNQKFDDKIRVSYSKTELVDSVDEVEHNIIREAMQIVGVERGIDIVYMADVPLTTAGIGLASSSSLAVGILNALHAYHGIHASAQRLAEGACDIEINHLKNPIGKQDQYAVAYGGINRFQFNRDGSVFVDPVICKSATIQRLQDNLLFFYTGTTRVSSSILQDQKKNIPDRIQVLDRLVELVTEAEKCLYAGDCDAVGALLHENWMLKKQLSRGISNPEIDGMYEKARRAGAIGGKILGAGGGGFLMLYVPQGRQSEITRLFSGYVRKDIRFERQGSRIIYVSD